MDEDIVRHPKKFGSRLTPYITECEDRVIANLSKDDNKMGLFLEGLDGHSLSATYMLRSDVVKLIGEFTDNKKASAQLKELVDDKAHELSPIAKEVRQNVKPKAFKLALKTVSFATQ